MESRHALPERVAKLEANYCWIGMKQDLDKHPSSCANCVQLKVYKQNQLVPNAVVRLDIHGPFTSFGNNIFITVLTNEAQKITSFVSLEDKS